MNESLDTLLSAIKSNGIKDDKLTNVIKSLTQNIEPSETVAQAEQKDMLKIKIDIINAIIPLLDDNAAEMAHFLIKLLTVITTIKQLKKN